MEDTASHNTNLYWMNILIMQSLTSSLLGTIFIVNFQSVKGYNFYLGAYAIIWFYCQMNGFIKIKENNIEEGLSQDVESKII